MIFGSPKYRLPLVGILSHLSQSLHSVRCSIQQNMGHPDAMFISFLPGRWKELEWGSGRKLSLWCFFPAWLMSISMTFWWKGQGRSASHGPRMITKKKVEMSPFPQSISIQVGPGAHFVAVPTCKEKSRVERESHTFHRFFSSPFKLIHLPD